MSLTREQILKAHDRKTVTVKVPEWGGEVIVSSMSGTDRDEFEAGIITEADNGKPDLKNMRAKLIAVTCVDEKGARLFSAADVVALGKLNSVALDRVARASQKLNRLGDAELEELKGN